MLPQLDEKRIAEHGLAVVLDTDLRKLHAQGRVSDAVLLIEAAFARHRSADTARIAELEREVARLREALQDIIDPMAKLRRNAQKQGRELEGWVAVQIANDVHFARAIATTALGGQS